MITKIEADHDGKPLHVYHRAGFITVDGIEIKDARYTWEHPLSEKSTCSACINGTIPNDVRRGGR